MSSFSYISICDRRKSPGIYGKIKGYANAFEKLGFDSDIRIIKPQGITGQIKLATSLFACSANIVITRYSLKLFFIYPILSILYRLKGQNLIIDIPTPLRSLYREVKVTSGFSFKLIVNFLLIYVFSPHSFYFSKLILEYAYEGNYISYFSKKKRILIGNCVEFNDQKKSTNDISSPNDTLQLISVGTVAPWHGWDRVLKAIKILIQQHNLKLHYTIVGEGPSLEDLKNYVRENNLQNHVTFKGLIPFDEIHKHYEGMQYGIGSFGWDRVAVDIASPIKTREYLSAGLNVIYATKDIDFTNNDLGINVFDPSDDINLLSKNMHNVFKSNRASKDECIELVKSRSLFTSRVKEILEKLNDKSF